jgi:hypothetical protein
VTPADVRERLTHALRLDLIGPDADEPQINEVLPLAPSRWYLSGFLVPWNASAQQKEDQDDRQGELEFAEAAGAGDEDDSTPEPRAARRSHFPSSMGVSVLVPAETTQLRVRARWGDYKSMPAKDGTKSADWRRTERSEARQNRRGEIDTPRAGLCLRARDGALVHRAPDADLTGLVVHIAPLEREQLRDRRPRTDEE